MNNAELIMTSALNVRSFRESALAENLANSDVPGYLPRDVDFKRALKAAVEETSQPARSQGVASEVKVAPENVRADLSGVDVTKELGEVFQNSLAYVATMKLFGDLMGRLKSSFS